MLKNRIIPCLDVKDGRVVKGINFVDLIDAGDPVEQASIYNENGADEICFLDITASSDKRDILLDTVKKTAERCFVPLTVGGGVRSIQDIRKLLMAGADKVSINTAAIKDPELIKESSNKFGSQCIVVAIDAKKTADNKWTVFTHGGREILLTSMDRDGTKEGYDIELTKKISSSLNIPVIASGGVGNLEHLKDGLISGGASAVLAASIFHFGQHSINEAKEYLKKENVPVRL